MRNIILAALGFVFIYNILLFETALGIGTGLLFLLLNLYFYLTKNPHQSNFTQALYASVLSVIFGFLIGWRSNEIIQILNLLAAYFFALVAVYFYKTNHFSFGIPHFLLVPLISLQGAVVSILGLLNAKTQNLNQENTSALSDPKTKSIIRGIAFAVPLVGLLLILLSGADPVFGKLTERFFANIWERLIVSVLLFIGLLAFGISKVKEYFVEKPPSDQESSHVAYELLIILGSIVTLFGLFMLVEIRYFFSNVGERELHELGIQSLTYSEYVRKGFFELLAASAVAGLVMIYVMKYLHKLKDMSKLLVQVVSSVFVIETMLLLFSASQRLNLYLDAHGLTRARIFGFIFLIWLGLMLAIFLIRILKEIKKQYLFETIVMISVGMFLLLNLINVDDLIATKYQPSVNDETDYYYLASLSPDASRSWVEAINDAQAIVTKVEGSKDLSQEDFRKIYWVMSTLDQLDNKVTYIVNKYSGGKMLEGINKLDESFVAKNRKWQSFILNEYDAYKVILENEELFKQLPKLKEQATKYYQEMYMSGKYQFPMDRSTQPPLI